MCITLVVWCFVLAFKWTRAICAGAFAVGSVTVGIAAYGQRGKVKSDSHTFFTAAKQDFAIHILSRLGNSSRLKLEDDFVDVKHVSVYTMFYISLFPIWILFWCLMMFLFDKLLFIVSGNIFTGSVGKTQNNSIWKRSQFRLNSVREWLQKAPPINALWTLWELCYAHLQRRTKHIDITEAEDSGDDVRHIWAKQHAAHNWPSIAAILPERGACHLRFVKQGVS